MDNKNIRKIIKLALMVAAGLALGYLAGRLAGNDHAEHIRLASGYKVLLFTLLIPIIIFVIAWHEAGHAIVGRSVGFDFRMFVVGPFLWDKTVGYWQFRWNKNLNIAGGLVLCVPKSTHDLKTNFIWFAAGGPLASLILAALAASISFFFFPPIAAIQTQGILLASTINGIIGTISFMIFLVTILPLYAGGFHSDGARILRLLRGGEKARFDMFLFSQIANSTNGLRPKLMDINTLEEAKTSAQRLKEPFAMYLPGILHQVYLDRNDWDAAEIHLQEYIGEASKMTPAIQDIVWLDAAFFYAFARKDLAMATQYWEKFKHSPFVPKAQIWATEAFLSQIKGDQDAAHIKKDAALGQLSSMIDKGLAVALKERLEQVSTRL